MEFTSCPIAENLTGAKKIQSEIRERKLVSLVACENDNSGPVKVAGDCTQCIKCKLSFKATRVQT